MSLVDERTTITRRVLRPTDPTGRYRVHDGQQLNWYQRQMFALIRNGFDHYRFQLTRGRLRTGLNMLVGVLLGMTVAVFLLWLIQVGFGGMLRATGLLELLERPEVATLIMDSLLYVAALTGIVLLYLPWRLTFTDHPIDRICDIQTGGCRVLLGRLDSIFQQRSLWLVATLLGGMIGLHMGLLYFTHDHLGLELDATLEGCFVLAMDSLLHGVLFDFCELNNWHLATPVAHSRVSAAVFLIFRLVQDGLIGYAIYLCWQRGRLQRMFTDYPQDRREFKEFCNWLRTICDERRLGLRRFPDEYMFLQAARSFLLGCYDEVRLLDSNFQLLKVTPPVRELFRKPGDPPVVNVGKNSSTRELHATLVP